MYANRFVLKWKMCAAAAKRDAFAFARAKTAIENRNGIKNTSSNGSPTTYFSSYKLDNRRCRVGRAIVSLALSFFAFIPSLKDRAQMKTVAIHNFSIAVARKELLAGLFVVHLPLRLKCSFQ